MPFDSSQDNLRNRGECLVCGLTETEDINWVQCDKCERWAHFLCVGVDEKVANVDWHCSKCVPLSGEQLTVPKQSKVRSRKSSKGDAGSGRETGSVRDPTEQQLEEEQLAREKAFAKQMEIRRKRIEQEIAWSEKQLEQERELQELELRARREMQRRRLEQETMLLEKQQADEREFRLKLNTIRAKVNRSVEISTDAEGGAIGGVPEAENPQQVNDWLQYHELDHERTSFGDIRGAYKKGGKPLPTLASAKGKEKLTLETSMFSAGGGRVDVPEIDEEVDRRGDVDDATVSSARGRDGAFSEIDFPDGPTYRVARLTHEQLAIRKSICNSLPKFNGDAHIWPLFINSYEQSTAACAYSNLENLKRLQDCLEGEALNAVRSMLVLPESVPEVIQDLKRLFGQPEKLMRTMLDKVRNAPAPKADRLGTFIRFGITVKQLCDHLEAARLTDHLNNPMMVAELVEKLPPMYQLQWVRYKRTAQGAPLKRFANFITDLAADVSEVADFPTAEKEFARPARGKPSMKEYVHVHEQEHKRCDGPQSEAASRACWICKRTDHRIKFCEDFRKMNVAERLKVVERLKLCGLCINKHGNHRCESKQRCHIKNCQGKHHPLLHRVEESIQQQKVRCNAHGTDRAVIFRMIPITLYAGSKRYDTLAFLDEGSSATFLDEGVANQLNAKGDAEPLIVTWTGNINRFENESRKVELMLSARGSMEKYPLDNVRTVSELVLPKQKLSFGRVAEQYPHLAGLPVVDYSAELPAILIGLDNLHIFAPLESRVGKTHEPIAVRTKVGWTVYGPTKRNVDTNVYLNLHSVTTVSNQQLHDIMREQYVLDETGASSFAVPEPVEERRARAILQATTKRIGKYFETGLLWREDVRCFPDSYPMAVRRLKALERKLNKDPALKQNVHRQIADYRSKCYAHKASEAELRDTPRSTVWYLPLNVVVNPRKPGKIRLVWDAAASVGGVSLNSMLLTGPDMLVPLPRVICHFRERPIAFGADIQEMYHQIRIRQEDKQAQRFLFRSSPTESPQVYIMDVATFGSTCSPCSAQYTKNLNAEEFAAEYPEAAEAIIHRHYVDDYYDSADTVQEAVKRASEVKYVHSQGGFRIRNWVSNSGEFLTRIGDRSSEFTVHFNRDKGTEYERVLGIVWEPIADVFCFATATNAEFQSGLDGRVCPTKRTVLSVVMAQFDPAGFLAPIVVLGKMLVQDLWRTGCSWDDRIDDVSFKKWLRWIQLLRNIESYKIGRSYFGNAKSTEIQDVQLHIFSDASETAYGCVAYFRAIVRTEVRCALVMSRAKVSPLKQLSIPRLELLAAVLSARLKQTIVDNHKFKISRVVYWTDANVVLSWIRSDQRRYKQFVGFRIGEILSLTSLSDWRWVPTRLNVADQLTKWGKNTELTSDCAWVRGPSFLYAAETDWPKKELPPANITEELRMHLLLHNVIVLEPLIDTRRFSKWTVLVRTMASVLRFVSNCRRKVKRMPIETLKATTRQARALKSNNIDKVRVSLQQEEYERAEKYLLKMAQAQEFIDELKVLKRNKERMVNQWLSLERSSPLYKLTPLVDESGLIRMEGRCERAESLPFDLRFPVILPASNRITSLIVLHHHERSGHGYRQTVKNRLKQLYYIVTIDAVVRAVLKSCMWCRIRRNRPTIPRMAPLPEQRITPYLRPFSYTGVDYLGPFEVTIGRRTEKRWIALFTCFVTRAIHLEVAHRLTTQSCLMAIYRFMGRRGWPLEFFSDNGTNFQGACKELQSLFGEIGNDCADQLTNARTKWTFNPPMAPHMGGVWERLVRSVKDVLKALDDGKRLTDEILQTAIVEAEDIINSRPLTYVTQQSDEPDILTPNHFLRVASFDQPTTNPFLPVPNPAIALRDAFQRSQELASVMWKRWVKEYVPSLNQRTKWFGETRPLKAGDLVYLVEGTNRKCWTRGLVEEAIPSKDGRVRQVWVKTNSGRKRRAVAQLALLEVDDCNADPEVASGRGYGPGNVAAPCRNPRLTAEAIKYHD